MVEHKINPGDARTIRKPPYRVPFALRKEMDNQIQDMPSKGVMGSKGVWLSRTGIVELLGSDIDGSLRGL